MNFTVRIGLVVWEWMMSFAGSTVFGCDWVIVFGKQHVEWSFQCQCALSCRCHREKIVVFGSQGYLDFIWPTITKTCCWFGLQRSLPYKHLEVRGCNRSWKHIKYYMVPVLSSFVSTWCSMLLRKVIQFICFLFLIAWKVAPSCIYHEPRKPWNI